MMEVKQSTPTDFNALSATTSNGKPDNMDVMSELEEASKLKNDILNTNDLPQNGLLSDVSNGFPDTGDGLDLDELIDLNDAVNPDLEDALLAEDQESGANVVDELLAEVVPKAVDVIDGKTAESSTTAATSLHNPGDDLDKLISKINDLEDCIETSSEMNEPAGGNKTLNDATAPQETAVEIELAAKQDAAKKDDIAGFQKIEGAEDIESDDDMDNDEALENDEAIENDDAIESEAIENAEDVEGAEETDKAENLGGAEDIEAAEDTEAAENIEGAEDIESAEDIEGAEDIESAEGIENEEDIADAEDIEMAKEDKIEGEENFEGEEKDELMEDEEGEKECLAAIEEVEKEKVEDTSSPKCADDGENEVMDKIDTQDEDKANDTKESSGEREVEKDKLSEQELEDGEDEIMEAAAKETEIDGAKLEVNEAKTLEENLVESSEEQTVDIAKEEQQEVESEKATEETEMDALAQSDEIDEPKAAQNNETEESTIDQTDTVNNIETSEELVSKTAKENEMEIKSTTTPAAEIINETKDTDTEKRKSQDVDSDDDIVFFAGKPEEKESSEKEHKEEKSSEAEKEIAMQQPEKPTTPHESDEQKSTTEKEATAMDVDNHAADGDDVVLLSDDDEDQESAMREQKSKVTAEKAETAVTGDKETLSNDAKSKETKDSCETTTGELVQHKEKSTTDEEHTAGKSELQSDNSDNACDKFESDKTANPAAQKDDELKSKTSDANDVETNSNCSSSSNLLQETQAIEKTPTESIGGEEDAEAIDEPDADDVDDADADADDGDDTETASALELAEEEDSRAAVAVREEKDTAAPPAKRPRLSEDTEDSLMKVDGGEEESRSSNKSGEEALKEASPTADMSDVIKIAEDSNEAEKIDKAVESAQISSAVKRSHESLDLSATEDDASKDDAVTEVASKKSKLEDETCAAVDTTKVEEDVKVQESVDVEANKKPPTTDITETKSSDTKLDTKLEDKLESKLETDLETTDFAKVLPQLRAVASDIPIPLYPAPKLHSSTQPTLKLDFFKRFRKNFNKLTRDDLEELVLQKVVEAIVHKSEFAEMRELADKQEKQITAHRAKVAEITKQFRDLEMVHTRVLKDIETKNSQFIMPVKITRAVGLQVYVPSKRGADGSSVLSLSSSHAQPTTSPQRNVTSSQMPPPSPPPRQANSSTSTSTTVTESVQRTANSGLATAAVAAAMNARRGCVQKVTPQRPVVTTDHSSSHMSTASTTLGTTSTYRVGASNTASPGAAGASGGVGGGTVLQSAMTQSSPSSGVTASSQSPNNMPRVLNKGVALAQQQQQQQPQQQQQRPGQRFLNSDNQRAKQIHEQQQQQYAQQQQQQQQYARQQAQNTNLRKLAPKHVGPTPQTQFRSPTNSSPNTSVDHYMTQLNQASPPVGTVTIASAKPKEKAVIDLTDEDEVPPAATPPTPPQPPQIRQRSINTSINTNTHTMNTVRNVPPLTRMPMNQQTGVRTPMGMHRQPQPGSVQKTNNSALMSNISTPPGTSITRVHISSTNMQAAPPVRKYNHPAPLPNTPPQPFSPGWKLPPPRPTIRISNLENGIVISWTMEDSMERYAECVTYQIYAYQETSGPPAVDSWRHVGDVKAMLLPMAVTLTQFQEGQRYYFAVRAVDEHKRLGQFSLPKTWS